MASTRNTSPSEHIEQRDFVSWFRQTYPDTLIFAVPNGGQRSPATAARLRMEGVIPGVWDLFVPAWDLWIELKRRDRGSLSAAQRDFGEAMTALGYRCMVAYGCDDGIAQLDSEIRESWQTQRGQKKGKKIIEKGRQG